MKTNRQVITSSSSPLGCQPLESRECIFLAISVFTWASVVAPYMWGGWICRLGKHLSGSLSRARDGTRSAAPFVAPFLVSHHAVTVRLSETLVGDVFNASVHESRSDLVQS